MNMNCARIAALLLLLAPCAASADVHPNSEGGFAPEKAFQVGEVDNINMFNGNLVLTIPIGKSYPVGGGLSYGLSLVYNSTPWIFKERVDEISDVTYTQAHPDPRSNAGLGWQVSLGRVFEPGTSINGAPINASSNWIYQGPDGNEHVFYDKLHHSDSIAANVLYTRDGSYLRMKNAGAGKEIEFPDGVIHRFDNTGMLTQIRNRFPANLVTVVTTTQPWTITDSHGRVQKVFFRTLPGAGDVIDRIELTAFGGAPATYTFNYSPNTIRRPCPHNDNQVLTSTVQVQLLTGVTLPDGSSYSMPSSDYVIDAPGGGFACRTSGSIRGLKLPTLGKIEWTYQDYQFPSNALVRPYRQNRAGVGTRRALDSAGALLGQWSYATSLTPSGLSGPQGTVYEQMVNSVTDPLGNRREHYFSVYIDGAVSSFEKEDYSLPFTKYDSNGGRFLSVRMYDAANVLKRSTYLRYQRDQLTGLDFLQDQLNLNRREETSRTVYHDDGNRYTEITRSIFDGLGHYRTTATGGSFLGAMSKEETVQYNPDVGTYRLGANGTPEAGFSMWPATSPWVLETYTDRTMTQGNDVDHTKFCFNSATGFLERTRTLKLSQGLNEDDVLVVLTADPSSGNVASESYHGADTHPTLSILDPCGASPGVADYVIDHTYQYGALATSQYAGASFASVDRTIDQRTGLALSGKDTAGLTTSYKYDPMGRLTWTKPAAGHDAWTEYVYQIATASSPAKLIVRKRGNGSEGAAVILPAQFHFDSLGRLSKELTFLPGSVWGVRETQYNGAGWKSQVSEVYPLNAPTASIVWTKYQSYDAFGRPGTVRPPDGPSHDVSFDYFGTRLVTRTVKVGTSYNAANGTVNELPAATTETYDHHGRLTKVVEPSGAGGANISTTYDYDAADRLIHVQTAAGVTQNRWFNYDGRGFLLSEEHPEKGAAGNGKVEYKVHDARGHATQMFDGPNALSYGYDKAERLTDIKEVGGRQLKKFIYDDAAGLGGGKVATATRYNYPLLGGNAQTVKIDETYTYNGLGGRVSKRDTEMSFNGTPAEGFTQAFTWNALGDVETLTYPACIVGRCPSTGTRTVTNGYTSGRLTSVASGGVTYGTLSYHLNGMVNQIAHANGVVDTQAVDANSMARPGSITSTLGAAIRWTTGTYSYDGAGNITKMGTSWFTYDKVSRLTTGTVFTGTTGGGTQKQQTYSFDAFGNLTEVGGSPGRTISIDPSTNRLITSTNPLTLTNYDAAGNLTNWNGAATYSYDAFNQMWRMKSGAEEWLYIYTADNERVWSFKVGANFSRWTLRDLRNNVLREYNNNGGTWSLVDDYFHRGDLLLASETPTGRQHFHLDHLGTPRLITNAAGSQLAYHVYYPFGEEATAFNQNSERRKFTGHERDLASAAGVADDLDYMHARHYSPTANRFLCLDRAPATPSAPQSWNRYAYTQNNPLGFIDPDGLQRWEIGKYLVMRFAGDFHHGGFHYDIFLRKGATNVARVALDGKVLTGAAPKALLKKMAAKGLISGLSVAIGAISMFFNASPAGAVDEFPAWFRSPEGSDLESLAKELFGKDLSELDQQERLKVQTEFYVRLKEDYEAKQRAEEGAEALQTGSCFYHGTCQ